MSKSSTNSKQIIEPSLIPFYQKDMSKFLNKRKICCNKTYENMTYMYEINCKGNLPAYIKLLNTIRNSDIKYCCRHTIDMLIKYIKMQTKTYENMFSGAPT